MNIVVLIATANEGIINEMMPSLNFTQATKNTSWFVISGKQYRTLRQKAYEKGYNQYALFTVLKTPYHSFIHS